MTNLKDTCKDALGYALICILYCGPPRFCGTRNQSLDPPPPLPKPLYTRKRRKLSLQAAKKGYLQNRSSLFSKIPAEVRVQIFMLVLGDHDIPLTMRYLHIGISKFHPGGRDLIAKRLLSFPLSCRRAYVEALPFLYAQSNFDIGDPNVIVRLPDCLLPQRLAIIQSLRFGWTVTHVPHPAQRSKRYRQLYQLWKDTWATLVAMEGLKTLSVFLYAPIAWEMYWKWSEAEILTAIRDAGTWKVEEFELKVSWPQISGQVMPKDLPFRLLRILGGPTAEGSGNLERDEQ